MSATESGGDADAARWRAEEERQKALQQLLNANGIREEDIKNPERVTHIEMVLDDYCCMCSLKYFTNLKSVCLIQQAISKIEGLEAATGLEKLVLNENQIEKVEGLGNCYRLKHLHLCANAITDLGYGLSGLPELEVLWIAENRLSTLDGIGLAPSIVELNASRNCLTSVVGALERNVKLKKLNLSDNRICSFRDILDLSRLSLVELSFADPDWGENPICLLCNYQTYTLYHCPGLKVFDCMRVADEEHQAAEAAFARKRLYYNMRMKLLKRQAADCLRISKTLEEERAGAIRADIEKAARELRRIEAWGQARQHNPPEALPTEVEPTSVTQRVLLERQLQEHQAELNDQAVVLEALRKEVTFERDALIRSLQLELQTGGNVRMEPSTPDREPWAKQIQDLVQARFRADQFARFGIVDIKVRQVTRVHNRSLRIRFEELLDRLEMDGGTRQLEYLFYIPDAKRASSHCREVVEEGPAIAGAVGPSGPAGFMALLGEAEAASDEPALGPARVTPARRQQGGDAEVELPLHLDPEGELHPTGSKPGPDGHQDGGSASGSLTLLTNSVAVAEVPKLDAFSKTATGQAQTRAARRGAALARRRPGSDYFGVPVDTLLGCAIGGSSGSGATVPTVCSGALLVCAAYLGEALPDEPQTFDPARDPDVRAAWQRHPSHKPTLVPMSSNDKAEMRKQFGVADPELRSLYRTNVANPKEKVWNVPHTDLVLPEYFVEFDYVYASDFVQSNIEERLFEHGPFAAALRDYTFFCKVSAPASPATADEEVNNANQGAAAGKAGSGALDLPQVEELDARRLLQADAKIIGSPTPDVLSAIQVLNLHGRGIRRLEPATLQPLRSLHVLLLSFNCMASTSALPACTTLTHLDLSFNFVEKVSSMAAMPRLKKLDMSWNSLGLSLEVRDLDAASGDVVRSLARDLSDLEVLDLLGNPMTRSPWYRTTALAQLPRLRTLDGQNISGTEAAQAKDNLRRFEGAVLSESVLMERCYAATGTGGAPAGRRHTPFEWCSERTRMATLLTPGSGPGGVAGAGPRLQGLTRASWRAYVESMDLRDLGLSDLTSFTGFARMRRLRLCGNRLTSLEKLAPCISLEELSVERNLLSSLAGAGSLPDLRRLDAGCNRICDVLDLRKLSKLTQLSLEDNLVDSLDTFAGLHNLVELYLSSNLIEEMRSVLLLKQLTKLLVLDLSGNDLCSTADARLYTIFHLRRLKVLDGIPVSSTEQQEAEDRFSGKITMELLEDKLGPSPSCYNFRSVDLSNQNLRELGQLLNDDIFPSLRELSLDGNPFTDIRTIGPLSKLLVLKVNRTKIDLEKGMLADDESNTGIASMPHLQVLELGYSGITDISHFANFPLQSLRILHLPGNEITRVEGLSHLEQLRELVLDKNKVKQLDEQSFVGLRSLRELRMDDNGLKSLAYMGPLPRLRALHLALNRIAELSELEKLRNLRNIVIINLSQNPVARKPLYRAHLINVVGSARAIDGREVTDEERERVEQMLQGSDSSRQQVGAGVYVFTDQTPQAPAPAAVPLAYVVPGLAGGDAASQQKGQGSNAGAAGGNPWDVGVRRTSGAELSARGVPVAQGHIMMTGLVLGEAYDALGADVQRGPAGGSAARRTAASHHPASGGDGSEVSRRTSAGPRSHSVPRQVGLDYRPGAALPLGR